MDTRWRWLTQFASHILAHIACFFADFIPIHLPFIPIPFVFPRDLVFLLRMHTRRAPANWAQIIDYDWIWQGILTML